jgi:hypothetical protein
LGENTQVDLSIINKNEEIPLTCTIGFLNNENKLILGLPGIYLTKKGVFTQKLTLTSSEVKGQKISNSKISCVQFQPVVHMEAAFKTHIALNDLETLDVLYDESDKTLIPKVINLTVDLPVNPEINVEEVQSRYSINHLEVNTISYLQNNFFELGPDQCQVSKSLVCGGIYDEANAEKKVLIDVRTCELELNEKGALELCGADKDWDEIYKEILED